MTIEHVKIGNKSYRLFKDVVLFPGTVKEVTIDCVAEEALEKFIQKKIAREEYHEVMRIDEMYGYYVPQIVADSEDEREIRESIEDVWDIDED